MVNGESGAYDNIRDHFPKCVAPLNAFDISRNGVKMVYRKSDCKRENDTLLLP